MPCTDEAEIFKEYGQDGNYSKLMENLAAIRGFAPSNNQASTLESMSIHTEEEEEERPLPNTPPTDPPQQVKVQYRLGKKDWEMLLKVGDLLNDVSAIAVTFSEWIYNSVPPQVGKI